MRIKINQLLIFLLALIFILLLAFLSGCGKVQMLFEAVDYFLDKAQNAEGVDEKEDEYPSKEVRKEIDKAFAEAGEEIKADKEAELLGELGIEVFPTGILTYTLTIVDMPAYRKRGNDY